MHAMHDPRLVALSILISIVAAYASRAMTNRFRVAPGRWWLVWLAGAAFVDGISTWSMHYTGMLGLRLPVPQLFDWRIVIVSYLVAVAGSGLAMLALGRGPIGWPRAIVTGMLLGGIGISAMHYVAISALRLRGLGYRYVFPARVAASVLVAIFICVAAVKIRSHTGAFLRGAANPMMHYTAMAALVFFPAPAAVRFQHTVGIASIGILGISIVPLMVLAVALLTTLADRLATQRALLDELFEQAPQAVALMTAGGSIVRVNREFTRMFGYTPEEATGQRLDDLVLDGDSDGRKESKARRKDGSVLPVSSIRVPVSVPGGQVEIYAILTDITERNRAEEALRSYPRRLLETQEAEGQRIARELHDEIGQVLTSVSTTLALGKVGDALSLVRDLIGRVRNLALDLRPSMLDDFGLLAAVQWLVQRYASQSGMRVAIEEAGLDEIRFSPEIEIAAYRVVQEALTNAVRHAQSNEAIVRILVERNHLIVEVEDHGAGFDRPAVLAEETMGLQGMRERVMLLGGRLRIDTAPGKGTRVRAEIPLER